MAHFYWRNFMPPTAPTTSSAALSSYQNLASGLQSPNDILSSQESSLGIPGEQQQVSGLRQAITDTTNLLNQVGPSVMGRTANSLVTSAQANRQIQNEAAPIQSKLAGLNASDQQAESDLAANRSKAATAASLQEQGQQNQLSSLYNIYQALYGQEQDSSKSAEAQREFDANQQQSASQLAEQEREANVSESQNQQKLDQSTVAPTQQDIAAANSDLIKLQGSDGYVSPQTYARAALSWANAGYSLADFNKSFGKFKNPNNPNYTL